MKRLFAFIGILGFSLVALTGCSNDQKVDEIEDQNKIEQKVAISDYKSEDSKVCDENDEACLTKYVASVFGLMSCASDDDLQEPLTPNEVDALDEDHECVAAIKQFAKFGHSYRECYEDEDLCSVSLGSEWDSEIEIDSELEISNAEE